MSLERDKPVVLVVDDDEDHVTMLEVALETAGYTVLTACSRAAAAQVLAERDLDALVSDLTLGDGTALDLLCAPARRPRVAIVLSGLDAPDDIARTREAGFDAHLVKPTGLDELVSVLADGLRRPSDRPSVMKTKVAVDVGERKRTAG